MVGKGNKFNMACRRQNPRSEERNFGLSTPLQLLNLCVFWLDSCWQDCLRHMATTEKIMCCVCAWLPIFQDGEGGWLPAAKLWELWEPTESPQLAAKPHYGRQFSPKWVPIFWRWRRFVMLWSSFLPPPPSTWPRNHSRQLVLSFLAPTSSFIE